MIRPFFFFCPCLFQHVLDVSWRMPFLLFPFLSICKQGIALLSAEAKIYRNKKKADEMDMTVDKCSDAGSWSDFP